MTFAYQEQTERRQPSEERGKVANWIIWPSILLIFCGLIMFAGLGIVYREFYNAARDYTVTLSGSFVFGMGMIGGGFLGAIGVVVYSFSFDGSPRTSTTKKTPVLMTPQEAEQFIGGNTAVHIPSSNAHKVEAGNRKYSFTNEQMRHLADRYFQENADYRVTRDNAAGKKMFQDWAFAKIVMIEAGYWADEGSGTYWTEEGGAWFEGRMRLTTA